MADTEPVVEPVETKDVEQKSKAGAAAVEDDEDDDLIDFKAQLKARKKKKKKKKKKKDAEASEGAAEGKAAAIERAEYAYTELLGRCFKLLQERNPQLNVKKRHAIAPPKLRRVGTRKTSFDNFPQIAQALRRNPEHMQSFVLVELGAEASNDANGRMIIKGRFVQSQIESLLKKYIIEYVTCRMCRSPDTTLTRDAVTRLHFLHCNICASSRSVAPINASYKAVTRAERRKKKMQGK